MTGKNSSIRQAFRRPVYLFVRVDPQGFVVNEELRTELEGRVARVALVRKLSPCVRIVFAWGGEASCPPWGQELRLIRNTSLESSGAGAR